MRCSIYDDDDDFFVFGWDVFEVKRLGILCVGFQLSVRGVRG